MITVNNVNVKIPQNNNREMCVSSTKILNIPKEGSGVLRKRAIDVKAGNPRPSKENGKEADIAPSMPRGKNIRNRRLISRQVLTNKKGNPRVLPINRATVGILFFKGQGASKQVKLRISSFHSRSFKLKLS